MTDEKKTVTITMRPDQAEEFSQWFGQMRVVDLPNPICDAIYVMLVAMKRGENVDVTHLTGNRHDDT